jgi:hypothetical protein
LTLLTKELMKKRLVRGLMMMWSTSKQKQEQGEMGKNVKAAVEVST